MSRDTARCVVMEERRVESRREMAGWLVERRSVCVRVLVRVSGGKNGMEWAEGEHRPDWAGPG